MRLFEPGRIGTLVLKNRIVMAPMGMGPIVGSHSRFSDRLIDHFETAAKGGTGLLITGMCRVSRKIESMMAPFLPTVCDHLHVEPLSRLADAVHDYRARIAIQLTAGFGRVALESFLRGHRPVAPSPLPYHHNPRVITRELGTEEIEELVREFEFAARLLRLAGIDAAELHAHEGYLWDQFQSEIWNRRTDKYGGSFEKRLRFTLEVIEAIKKGAGADFPIIYRMGLKHCLPGGRDVEEGLEIARRLDAAGVDALEVDVGCYETWYWAHPTSYQPPGLMVDVAELTKKVVRIPVIAVGKLGYPDLAESVLQDGKADFVALGRALLADPEWPNKVKCGRLDDIRPCIGDNEGCLGRLFTSKYTSCSVNPTIGAGNRLGLSTAKKKRKVLVIGGGPAGMEASRVAALRGHKVTLLEKGEFLGGNLVPASMPDFKRDYRDLIKYLRSQVHKLGIAVELEREATQDLIKGIDPDAVIVAVGAEPITPDLPGIDQAEFATAAEVLLSPGKVGKSVIVVGGGLMGCETALHLARQGKKVTVIEALPELAGDAFKANRMYLLEMMSDARVDTWVETRVVQVEDNAVTVERNMEKRRLGADSIVIAMGYRPRKGLMEAIRQTDLEAYAVGDCVEARNVKSAIWEGYRTARLV